MFFMEFEARGYFAKKNWRYFSNLMYLEYFQDHYLFKIIHILNILSANPGLYLEYPQQGVRS